SSPAGSLTGVFELDGEIYGVGANGTIYRNIDGSGGQLAGWDPLIPLEFFEPIDGYRPRIHRVRSTGFIPSEKGVIRLIPSSLGGFGGVGHVGVHPALYSLIELADPSSQTAHVVVPAESQVSYRIVFRVGNASTGIKLSAPSPRHIVQNHTMDPLDVRIRVFIPTWGLDEEHRKMFFHSHFLIFRTAHTDLLTDPGDEHFLVREVRIGQSGWNDL